MINPDTLENKDLARIQAAIIARENQLKAAQAKAAAADKALLDFKAQVYARLTKVRRVGQSAFLADPDDAGEIEKLQLACRVAAAEVSQLEQSLATLKKALPPREP